MKQRKLEPCTDCGEEEYADGLWRGLKDGSALCEACITKRGIILCDRCVEVQASHKVLHPTGGTPFVEDVCTFCHEIAQQIAGIEWDSVPAHCFRS
jgi:hypothetical protein